MARITLVPKVQIPADPSNPEVQAARAAFGRAGFAVVAQNGQWRTRLLRSGDRFLSDAELILLARSLPHA